MNWDEVSAIGQVLGSVAVFVTLGYLAVQLRHSRAEVRRTISQSRSEALRQLTMQWATDERLGNLNHKAELLLGAPEFPFVRELGERTGTTTEEGTALFWNQMAWWFYRTHTFSQVQELSRGERQNFASGLKIYGHGFLAHLWYETSKPYLNSDVVRYVDNLLAQAG